MSTNEELLEERIQNVPYEKTLVYPSEYEGKYKLFELYYIAIRRSRSIVSSNNLKPPYDEFMLAREASKMTAYRFLSEIKKLMPNMYEHFWEMAAHEILD